MRNVILTRNRNQAQDKSPEKDACHHTQVRDGQILPMYRHCSPLQVSRLSRGERHIESRRYEVGNPERQAYRK